MSNDLPRLQHRREQILQEMADIDQLCRGHLSQQFFQSKQAGKTIRRGPYYVLQRWFRGKNLCERVAADQLEHIRKGVEGYKPHADSNDKIEPAFNPCGDWIADVNQAGLLNAGAGEPLLPLREVKEKSGVTGLFSKLFGR